MPPLTTDVMVNHLSAEHGVYTIHPDTCAKDEVFIPVEHITDDAPELGFCVQHDAQAGPVSWVVASLRCLHLDARLPEPDEWQRFICPHLDSSGKPFGAPPPGAGTTLEWIGNQSQWVFSTAVVGSDQSGLGGARVVPRGNIRNCDYTDLGVTQSTAGTPAAATVAFFRCVH
jgi:hypothetical protein